MLTFPSDAVLLRRMTPPGVLHTSSVADVLILTDAFNALI
jgi:hypothetical protein